MIPIRLELKNFMAYRDAPVVDLTGLHVVCLTGENGAGKSTLLDAITWALWGQARSKRDDELITQNETEMRVSLVFKEGSNTYQVVRTRKLGRVNARSKIPTSTGELGLLIEDSGSWRSLNEGRQSDTQAKIIHILNLTYETFVNSAFLKQGRADEFTLKTPGERKALLAEILSLDIWADYEERVKQEQNKLEENRSVLAFDLRQTEEEILKRPTYEQELAAAQAAVGEAQQVLARADEEMTEIERQRERVRGLRTQVARADDAQRAVQSQMKELVAEREKHRQLLAEYQEVISQRDELERCFAEYQTALKQNDELNLKLTSLVELNARKTEAEGHIADARRKLESERDMAAQLVQTLKANSDTSVLTEQLMRATEQLDSLKAQQEIRETLQRELTESREQQAELRARNDELRGKMKELKARINAISSVAARCPTCGRDLGEDERQRLLAEWNEQGRQWGDTFRAADDQMKKMVAARSSLEEKLTEADRSLTRLPGAQRDVSAIEDRLVRANDALAQLPPAQEALVALQGRLTEQDYAQDARAALATVTQELTELGYDAAAHRQLREVRLPQLRVYAERKEQLDRSALGIESEQRALETLALRESALADQMRKGDEVLAALRVQMADCEKVLQRAPQVEATAQRARLEFFAAQRKEAEANQRVQSCIALEAKRTRLQKELDTLAHKQSHLIELRTAFGKNGVPAMIIEAILPELEDSARDLLYRMSNNRMSVRFETQRQTQKGDVSETLELRISDELGERPYEMYSGGEAFRINFAIRVALSKLLANRNGAKLQTLFIDEGFGTQDTQGRERLVEAIRSIQDDFELIVVITHIEELKASFEAQIDVTKTPDGSIARVV
jgi:exonuclease SbcC